MSIQRTAAGMNAKALIATVAALSLVFVGGAMSVSAAPAPPDTGFNETNAGVVKYQPFAPTEATRGAAGQCATHTETSRSARPHLRLRQRQGIHQEAIRAFCVG